MLSLHIITFPRDTLELLGQILMKRNIRYWFNTSLVNFDTHKGLTVKIYITFVSTQQFHVGQVVQNRRSALPLALHEWLLCQGKEWKIYCSELPLSSESQIWQFYVVVCQTTSKHRTKKRATRVAQLYFFIQPIKSLICGVVVDVAVVKS